MKSHAAGARLQPWGRGRGRGLAGRRCPHRYVRAGVAGLRHAPGWPGERAGCGLILTCGWYDQDGAATGTGVAPGAGCPGVTGITSIAGCTCSARETCFSRVTGIACIAGCTCGAREACFSGVTGIACVAGVTLPSCGTGCAGVSRISGDTLRTHGARACTQTQHGSQSHQCQ